MKEGYAAIELCLNAWRAGDWEGYLSKLFRGSVVVHLLRAECDTPERQNQNQLAAGIQQDEPPGDYT